MIDLVGQKFSRLTVQSRGPNSKAGKIRWWCLCDCGGYKLVQASNLRTSHVQSCGCLPRENSIKQMAILRLTQFGEMNPNWKGAVCITPKKERLRKSELYKIWRSAIFEYDNYICQKCEQSGGILNGHHIEAFTGNSELRTKVSNGITFCETCHKNFHHQYGNDCNRKQLEEFLENSCY